MQKNKIISENKDTRQFKSQKNEKQKKKREFFLKTIKTKQL